MVDWRVYTGTQRLQLGWTLLVLLGGGVVSLAAQGPVDAAGGELVLYGGLGGAWLVGLLVLAYRERRAWQRLVADSSFERGGGVDGSDLQRIVRGHTVSVSMTVPSVLAQTHTRVRATVDGVDADFTVRLRHAGPEGGASGGLTTGNPELDDRFVIEGAGENVQRLLSTDVQAALMDLEPPGTVEATGDAVVLDVPFTRVSPGELDAAAQVVVELVDRIETVGRS